MCLIIFNCKLLHVYVCEHIHEYICEHIHAYMCEYVYVCAPAYVRMYEHVGLQYKSLSGCIFLWYDSHWLKSHNSSDLIWHYHYQFSLQCQCPQLFSLKPIHNRIVEGILSFSFSTFSVAWMAVCRDTNKKNAEDSLSKPEAMETRSLSTISIYIQLRRVCVYKRSH